MLGIAKAISRSVYTLGQVLKKSPLQSGKTARLYEQGSVFKLTGQILIVAFALSRSLTANADLGTSACDNSADSALSIGRLAATVRAGINVGSHCTNTSGESHAPPGGTDPYGNAATYDFQNGDFRMLLLLPDLAYGTVNGAVNGAKILFLPNSGTTRSVVTVSCPNGTVTGNGTTTPEIKLTAGSNCQLTAVSSLTTAVSYEATLTRTGNVYTVSAGTLKGDVFGGTPVTISTTSANPTTDNRSQQSTQNFINNRTSRFGNNDVGIGGSLNGTGPGDNNDGQNPFTFNLTGTGNNHQGSFSASLNGYLNYHQQQALRQSANAGETAPDISTPIRTPANLWIKGRWTHAEEDRGDIDEKSDFAILNVGADYRWDNDTLFGIMAQVDHTDEESDGLDTKARGTGWMLGPYLVKRLNKTLTADLLAAWGTSSNEINVANAGWDDFDTERWMVEGNLTGSYNRGKWNIKPALGLLYVEETQEAYTDSTNTRIQSQTASLGRLTFGPTVSYTINGANGGTIKPLFGIIGVWDFDAPDINGVGGTTHGTEGLRAKAKLGITVINANGMAIQGVYTYDGIGLNDYESHTGELTVSMPLNTRYLPNGSSLNASYSVTAADLLSGGISQLDNEDIHSGKVSVTLPLN